MYKISRFIFWSTLILYIITLCTVSYVGVYLTYIAIPIIIISGLIMKMTKPKFKKEPSSEFGKAANEFFSEVSNGLDQMNTSLDKFNKKFDLISERTEHLKNKRNLFRQQKIEPEIELKYAKTSEEKSKYSKIIRDIDQEIIKIDCQIDAIKKQCELDIERQYV